MISFANALEPSSRAAAARGPKQRTPAAASASASPATSGASGPDDDEVDGRGARGGGERRRVVGRRVERARVAADAGVAGRAQDLGLLRGAQERPDERVLAPARADDEDPHTAPMKSSIGIAASDS